MRKHITRVYAISAGRLSRWEYDDGVNQWTTQGVPEIWEDGTPVDTTLGIAVTHGADSNGSCHDPIAMIIAGWVSP